MTVIYSKHLGSLGHLSAVALHNTASPNTMSTTKGAVLALGARKRAAPVELHDKVVALLPDDLLQRRPQLRA